MSFIFGFQVSDSHRNTSELFKMNVLCKTIANKRCCVFSLIKRISTCLVNMFKDADLKKYLKDTGNMRLCSYVESKDVRSKL